MIQPVWDSVYKASVISTNRDHVLLKVRELVAFTWYSSSLLLGVWYQLK